MSNLKEVRQKEVVVELGGNEWTIRFDLNAFALVEEEFGDIDTLMDKVVSGGAKATIALLWAGLQCHHEGITKKEVGALIDLSDMPRIAQAIYGGVNVALPQGTSAKNA